MEERLLRASQDDLGYRDFASYAAGARPIESLTSSTWDGPPPLSPSTPPDFLRGKQMHGPAWALKRDLQQGSCWPMAGTAGYLGIHLAEPVIITNVTIDHLPTSLASETRSAPHHVRVWALVPASGLTTHAATSVPPSDIDLAVDPAVNATVHDLLRMFQDAEAPGTRPMHIADVEYDTRSVQHIQNFPVYDDAASVRVDKVVFQILDNWGLPEFTCIYRVRVHGRPAK